MSNQDKGGAADQKAMRAASILAVEFESNRASDLLRSMATATSDGASAKASKEEASILFCQFAASMVSNELERDGGSRDRGVITEGFCKHMDVLRPALAAEGSPLVEVKSEDGKDTVAATVPEDGTTEYVGIHELDTPELIDVFEADSFTDIKKSVQVCRQSGEEDAARELREAKEAYREIEASVRKLVLGQKTAASVTELSESVAYALVDMQEIIEARAAYDADEPALDGGGDAVIAEEADGRTIEEVDAAIAEELAA